MNALYCSFIKTLELKSVSSLHKIHQKTDIEVDMVNYENVCFASFTCWAIFRRDTKMVLKFRDRCGKFIKTNGTTKVNFPFISLSSFPQIYFPSKTKCLMITLFFFIEHFVFDTKDKVFSQLIKSFGLPAAERRVVFFFLLFCCCKIYII